MSGGVVGQLLRFALVGVLSNAVLYILYLALTAIGTAAKVAMTIVYAAGVLQTFLFNRAWTFSAIGGKPGAFRRYCASYALGYAVNLLALHVFVDVLGYPHQIVQASALVGVAVLLFVTQRFWVFR